MEDRITVAQTLELGVSITWQQAVAITLEAWHVAVNAQVRERPVHLGPESCVLTVGGDVLLPRPSATYAPDAAQQLLRALLNGVDAPPELVDIAFSATPASLSDDLAAFSRPNRRVEVVDVATRAVTALAALGLKARPGAPVFETALATVAPEPAAAPPPPASASAAPPPDPFSVLREEAAARPVVTAPRPTRRPSRAAQRWVPVVAGAVATLAAVIAWRAWPDAASSAAPPSAVAPAAPVVAVDDATVLEASPPDPSWSAAGRRDTDIPLARRAAPARAAGSAASKVQGAVDDTAVAAAASTTATAPPTPDLPRADPPSADAFLEISGATTPFPDEATVYSWTSDGVTPPTMIFPRMPRSAFPEPGANVDDRPYLEVLVNERGDVDAVRLRGDLTSSELVRHGMMLAPAKAWHFSPATRDGRPVPYVVRVLVGQ